MRVKSKRFFYVFVVPVVIFAIGFGLTMLQRAILYLWLGFFVAWGVHFYAQFYYYRKLREE
ncbi:MAG: hypothetical protein OEZ29_06610 [Candidatus Bathyarchaeota archaeon]|nr:hypothetical protein [Candidatus Bathyarchaeota archaeon]MDH5780251.1 hypothetical protein [Candidatus Bathyarchaeota archaeon]